MKTLEAQVPEILLDEVIELAAKQHTSVDPDRVAGADGTSLCLAHARKRRFAGSARRLAESGQDTRLRARRSARA
jgi:hypothetical protein